jgi:hypothetical protein
MLIEVEIHFEVFKQFLEHAGFKRLPAFIL